MDKINLKPADLATEMMEEKIADVYSDFIQGKLHEFYMQDLAAQSYDNDAEFYGEVV